MELRIGLLVCLCLHSVQPFGFDDLETIFSITESTVTTLAKVPELAEFAENAGGSHDGIALPFSKTQRQLIPMFKKFAEVTNILRKVDHNVREGNMHTLSTLQQNLPVAFRYEMKLDSIEDTITLMDLYYQNFLAYTDLAQVQMQDSNLLDESLKSDPPANLKFDKFTLEDFAVSLTSHVPTSVRGLMERINEMVVPSSQNSAVRVFMRDGLFDTILKFLDELDNSICGTEMSPQQLIYNLYSSLQVTQVKAYVMMQFAWTLLHLYGKGNFTTETETLQVQFKQRLVNQMDTVKTAMGKADTVVYKCDPKVHVEGQTYAQLTQLLQGFLINEVDMNPKTSCTDNCGTYKLVNRQYGCFDNQFCARQKRCDGTIQNCQFYDADMTLCPSTGNASTTRRYDWIEYENGITLGKKSHCKSFQDKVDSWWRFWYHCSYCMCLCDARYSSTSHRYWSLRPVQSDIGQNKIIVGIRFIKLNKVVHIQIRQATLLPKLLLNTTTAEWVPVSKIDVGDNKRTVEGLDYHKMTYEKRALDLDDVILPAKYLVTGVQFRMLGSHLNLEIQGTAFNYETGQLEKGLHHKQSNDNTDVSENPRTQLNLDNLDVSTSSPSPSTPNPLRNSFILFTHSSLEDDVAQPPLPFIDIQPVSTTPLSPLSGVGVYHKGTPGYGGFVAPRLFTFDPTQYVVESEVRLEEQK
uniref:Uncharacterized protein n=1 Tax=Cacopsylla melanoneura TaxID=428564 RepID=A0A8D9BA48_9HEMI